MVLSREWVDDARTAVRALVTFWDPNARVSAPLWRRTDRLCRRVLTALDELSPGVERTGALDLLRRNPLDPAAQEQARGLIDAAIGDLGSEPVVLRQALEEFRARNRIVLETGSRHGDLARVPSPDVVGWAREREYPLLGTGGSWELTVVLDFRDASSGDRFRNTVASLMALHDQTLDRDRYRLVAVEQDTVPRHADLVRHLVDSYVHASNGGPYNRSWAHNVGAVATGGREGSLCFLDADILPDAGLLARALDRIQATGAGGLVPHRALHYLDGPSTATALHQRLAQPGGRADPETLHGYRLDFNRGGCIFADSALFHRINGFDERYEGWGDEDNEFFDHLTAHTSIDHGQEVLLHLDHPRPAMEHDGRRPNEWLLGARDGRARSIGDPARYRHQEG